jgi:hypothetical protein
VFEEKIIKPMELYWHANSNVISMNSVNTIIVNAMEKSKLWEADFYLFSSPALEEKICSDDTLSPIYDNSNNASIVQKTCAKFPSTHEISTAKSSIVQFQDHIWV